jgi:hypothetical protein
MLRLGGGLNVLDTITAKQYSLNPSTEYLEHRVPLSVWHVTGSWREDVTNRRFALTENGHIAGSRLIVPISGFIPYNSRVVRIRVQYSTLSYPTRPVCSLLRTPNVAAGAAESTANLTSNAPNTTPTPLSASGYNISEHIWTWSWSSPAQSLPLRRSDPYTELVIESAASGTPVPPGYVIYVYGVVVDWYRTGI